MSSKIIDFRNNKSAAQKRSAELIFPDSATSTKESPPPPPSTYEGFLEKYGVSDEDFASFIAKTIRGLGIGQFLISKTNYKEDDLQQSAKEHIIERIQCGGIKEEVKNFEGYFRYTIYHHLVTLRRKIPEPEIDDTQPIGDGGLVSIYPIKDSDAVGPKKKETIAISSPDPTPEQRVILLEVGESVRKLCREIVKTSKTKEHAEAFRCFAASKSGEEDSSRKLIAKKLNMSEEKVNSLIETGKRRFRKAAMEDKKLRSLLLGLQILRDKDKI